MEWMQRFNQSIEYIEEHITEELDYERVAEVAACPSYYHTGISADSVSCIYGWRAAIEIQSGGQSGFPCSGDFLSAG